MSTEVASAYVALYAKMPGLKGDIESALGDATSAAESSGKNAGGNFRAGFAGAVGGVMASVASKAMDLISGSIDGAIARVDTLNNFPIIMENLGYSSEEAASAIEMMSDGLAGLPTSLDQMAGVAQKLAPLTGGLEEATELSLALNNAMLAGGKDTQTQANAMEQYTQMLAVGKVDMAAWRSMVSAMPGQMDQLAESLLGVGNKSMDLYSALQSGTIGFDEFNDAIVQLNQEGTGEFASFADQAIGATGGIGTTMANFQTAITRGLADIIQEAQPLISGLVAGGTEVANQVLPLMAEGVAWLGEMFKDIDLSALFEMAGSMSPVMMIFDTLKPVLPQIVDLLVELGTVLAGNIASIFQLLAPILLTVVEMLVQLAAQVIPVLIPIITTLFQAFGGIMDALLPIVQMILPVLMELFNALMPTIMMLIEAITPLIMSVLQLVAPLLDLVMQILPPILGLFMGLVDVIMPVVEALVAFLIPVIMAVVDAIVDFLTPVIESITDILLGVMDFIIGVFTGDWEKAWEGIVQIFSGIWEGLKGIVVGVVNFIIDMINGVINGLNEISGSISDLTGGAINLSIPNIPRLAQGGIVSARPGGILANIGEGRHDEAVVPLDDKFYSALSGRGEVNVNVYPSQPMDEHLVGRVAADELAYMLRR